MRLFRLIPLVMLLAGSFAVAAPPAIPMVPPLPASAVAQSPDVAPAPAPGKFQRGLKPSPQHKIRAVPQFSIVAAPPSQFVTVPKLLRMWGNNTYGVCVSSQEAFSLDTWSTRCLGADKAIVATDAEVIAFARQHGWLNGANLTEVMDTMRSTGMKVGGVTYKDGSYYSVDYSKPVELQTALYTGPVNIAIDADALPAGAGNKQGWFAVGKGRFPSTDHCVALAGYGSATYLYEQLGVPLPAGLPGDKQGYLLFTWSTLGFVDHDWLMGTCTEAYVRAPTTVGMSPPVPPPLPVLALTATPTSGPAPLTVTFVGNPTKAFTLAFGDGSPMADKLPAVHTYAVAGSYLAKLSTADGDASVTVTVGSLPPPPPPGDGVVHVDTARKEVTLPAGWTVKGGITPGPNPMPGASSPGIEFVRNRAAHKQARKDGAGLIVTRAELAAARAKIDAAVDDATIEQLATERGAKIGGPLTDFIEWLTTHQAELEKLIELILKLVALFGL